MKIIRKVAMMAWTSNLRSNLRNIMGLTTSRHLQPLPHCCLRKLNYHTLPIWSNLGTVNRMPAAPKPINRHIFCRDRPSLASNRFLRTGTSGSHLLIVAPSSCLQYTTCSSSLRNDHDDNKTGPSGSNKTFKENGQRLLNEQKDKFQTMLDEAQSSQKQDSFDFKDVPQQEQFLQDTEPRRVKVDPKDMSVLLFPSQGAQFVGMGKKLLDYPIVKDMYEVASAILGYDLLALCLNGPREDLDRTVYCQPAVLVTSLAAVEKLKEENIKAIENCVATAGFSVGEYAALVFGGALSFEDAIYLIKVRAEAMQQASDAVPSGMISVTGGRGAKYKEICAEATRHCQIKHNIEKPVCRVANYLFPNARVLAGNKEALDYIIEMKDKFSLRNIKHLPVSGAFHTSLMAQAEDSIAGALDKITIEQPLIKIHSNVDSKAYGHEKHIRKQLRRQVVEPVLWEQTLGEIYQREQGENFPQTYEVGPGRQLGAMLQRFNKKAFRNYYTVEV